jgi:nitrite reductase/ring-hydroxylating ferredoxin subunit/uncharacterized membrane protein
MKSKANIKGHPLHPILVSFPITFFSAAFALDAVQLFVSGDIYGRIAHYLGIAGIITAILAAVPGVMDFIYVVPPRSSANKRAAVHGALNGLVVIIFTAVLFLRKENADIHVIIACEGIGVVLLGVTGWMGGTLMVRNQIGIDHRYAHAGRWSEERIPGKPDKVIPAGLDKLLVDQMKLVHVNGKRIVIARTDTGFVAFDDRCSHRGGSLADGVMICGTVQCPWHGSQFDCRTGLLKAGPAKENIRTYALKEENGKITLNL